jgi:hypothetical protein
MACVGEEKVVYIGRVGLINTKRGGWEENAGLDVGVDRLGES